MKTAILTIVESPTLLAIYAFLALVLLSERVRYAVLKLMQAGVIMLAAWAALAMARGDFAHGKSLSGPLTPWAAGP
jgi:hypothetical protein